MLHVNKRRIVCNKLVNVCVYTLCALPYIKRKYILLHTSSACHASAGVAITDI